MTDIQRRIADIVGDHWTESDDGYDGDWLMCECPRRFPNVDSWARHVAEVLVSELGLARNTATVRSNAGWATHPGTKAGDVMVRYVTEWVADERKA